MEYRVVVQDDGNICWYKAGTDIRHREGGPAVHHANGYKCWYVNGKCHREDGPAEEYANGSVEFFLDGKWLTKNQFLEMTKPVKELTVNEIEALLGYKIKVVGQ